VTLEPIPESGWLFGDWDRHSDCADGHVTMNDKMACGAIFREQPPLTVAVNGSATVTSSPAGVNWQVIAVNSMPAAPA
jgi:hypothetical protein